ncbi:division initiation protein [Desulfocucumis palustris]|uniref:Division initiation protein n=1 Tax=Desulfocucumis palustris TaxID=1898651 RepID=A0A2L2XJK1_9FIRM|nr:DUF881 domain-containing protein [Desulfocucumis palustris]GBF34446.1 division initiation protein [Desulfocucumis palustris]
MNRSFYISVTVVALIIGIMLAVQFRTNRFIEQGVPSDRAQELTAELHQLDKDIDKLENEVYDLEYKLTQARKGQSQAVAAIGDELEKARIYAGFVPLKGPGVEIILNNPPLEKNMGILSDIQDIDILGLVNELRVADAEAISVDGQRIISTSEIRLAGQFINVNLTRLTPPYHVLAIGDGERLKSALEIPNGQVEHLRDLGIQVDIQTRELIEIPAYTGSLKLNFAKTTKG